MQMYGPLSFNFFDVILIIIIAILCIKAKTVIRIAYQVWNKTSNYEFIWKAIFYAIPVAGLLGVIIPSLFGLINLTMLGIYLAIPMIVAPAIYYVVFHKSTDVEATEAAGG